MKNKVVARQFVRELDCSAAVAWWNYWDHEHVPVLHRESYTDMQVLYENSQIAIVLVTYRLPFLGFIKSRSMSVMVRQDNDTMCEVNVGLFGIPCLIKIKIHEDRKDHCVFEMSYQFALNGWKRLLAPFMSRMIQKWNDERWQEDLPLKVRRQKMLRHGFRDFVGMPARIADRLNDGPLSVKLPLARPAGSPVDEIKDLLK